VLGLWNPGSAENGVEGLRGGVADLLQSRCNKTIFMAKYSKESEHKVERSMHEMKEGRLKSGHSGKKVTNPKQAIAIGLSEARKEGAKVPDKKLGARKKAGKGK
jgi:hypothetical protein